jgi:hypothetical protein
MAMLANDACGAPLPWQLTCPWNFFDGKIFHLKLLKATSGRPLLEVCDGEVQQLVEVERMRDAILAGRSYELAPPRSARPEAGECHDEADAGWIVIRRLLRGHNDTPFGRPSPDRPIGHPGVSRP